MQHPLFNNVQLKPTIYQFDEDQIFDQLGFCHLADDVISGIHVVFLASLIPYFEKINIQRFSCDSYLWAENYSEYLYEFIKPFNNCPNCNLKIEEILADDPNGESYTLPPNINKNFNYNIPLDQGKFLFTWLSTDKNDFYYSNNQGIVITKQSLIIENSKPQNVNFTSVFEDLINDIQICANSLRCFEFDFINNIWIEFFPNLGLGALYKDIQENFNNNRIALETAINQNFSKIYYKRDNKTYINYNCFPRQKYLKKISVNCDFNNSALAENFTDYQYVFEDIPQYLKNHCYLHFANNNYWNNGNIYQDLGVSFDKFIRHNDGDFSLNFNPFGFFGAYNYDNSKFAIQYDDPSGVFGYLKAKKFFYEINKQLFFQYHATAIYPKYQILEVKATIDPVIVNLNDENFVGEGFDKTYFEEGQEVKLYEWYYRNAFRVPTEGYETEYAKEFIKSFYYPNYQQYNIPPEDYRKFKQGFLDPSGDKPFFINSIKFSRLSDFVSSAQSNNSIFDLQILRGESYGGSAYYEIEINADFAHKYFKINNLDFKTFFELAKIEQRQYDSAEMSLQNRFIDPNITYDLDINQQTINKSETLEFYVEFGCYSETEFYNKINQFNSISETDFINIIIDKNNQLKLTQMYLALEQIKRALDADKYSDFIDSTGNIQPSESALGNMICRTAKFLGINFNRLDEIQSIRQSKGIPEGKNIPEGWYFGQCGLNYCDGKIHNDKDYSGQNGGNLGDERLGIVYTIKCNQIIYNSEGLPIKLKAGEKVLCENLMQYLELMQRDLDKALDWQNLGGGLIDFNGKTQVTEGLFDILQELTVVAADMNKTTEKARIATLINQQLAKEILKGLGLPSTVKKFDYILESNDPNFVAAMGGQEIKYDVPYNGVAEGSPTIASLFLILLENLALGNVGKLQLSDVEAFKQKPPQEFDKEIIPSENESDFLKNLKPIADQRVNDVLQPNL